MSRRDALPEESLPRLILHEKQSQYLERSSPEDGTELARYAAERSAGVCEVKMWVLSPEDGTQN